MRSLLNVALLIGACHLLATAASAQSTRPVATTVSTQPQAMDRESLVKLYRIELGEKFDDAKVEELIRAHELIEAYFAKPKERKETVALLEATGIDANILGRLTRIRMHWPGLQGGVYYINERVGPHMVKYFLGVPKNYDRTKAWPLLIKLPAADSFVKEPRATADMVVMFYTRWAQEEIEKHPDTIVILPLLNLDELYGPSYQGMHTVIQPMLHAADRVNIDPKRVYMVGHSMSAHAVWNLALHYPMYFAAINPLAGGARFDWQRVRLPNLRNVLPVVWHDSTDKQVNVNSSRQLVRVLKQQKIDVDFDETKGIGHVPNAEVLHRAYERLIGRVRELYPKRVTIQSNRPDTIFNRIDWAQIYQPFDGGEESWLLVSRGRGHMVVYQHSFRLDATMTSPNRIDATTDNVAVLRFYFNDQTIDFNKPVTININKKGVFEAKIQPSIDEMLKDQIFVGRGWRYFTGVVDIDLSGRPASGPTSKPTSRPTR